MDPHDTFEKVARGGRGFVAGCIAGLAVAGGFLPWQAHYVVVACLVGGGLCAILALKFEDQFWSVVSHIDRFLDS